MNKSQNGSSPNSRKKGSKASEGESSPDDLRWQFASSMQDRLEMLTGRADPRYVLSLAARSHSLRELIRRYSNDSML